MPGEPVDGDEIVARLDEAALAALGGHSDAVRLSRQTAEKQAVRHPDLAPADYDIVQELVDRGTVVREGERTLVFAAATEDGKRWRAVVKRTADRRRTYLVTFHRINPNQIGAARRRGSVIRCGAGERAAPGGAQSLLTRPKPRV